MAKRLLLLSLIIAVFWSCSKLNPKIATPSYLQIDSFQVVTSPSQGTSNHKFADVLVESKTYNYGYYPIPGKIPIPFTGATYLIVRPVIKVNGVSALRVDYPLMHGYDTTFGLTAGQVLKVTPVFKYYPTVNFRFTGDFEGSNQMKNSNAADTFGIEHNTDPLNQMPGSTGCLRMKVDAAHPTCQAQSFTAFQLPTDGTNIYLEINYKGNVPFEVGLIGTNMLGGGLLDQRTVGGPNASAGWNKMYFSFSEMTRTPPKYPYYYLYFLMNGYNGTSTTNEVFIDNIKVISQR